MNRHAAVVLLLLGLVRETRGKLKTKDWSNLDLEKINEEWRDGDDPEDLLTERQLYEREVERRKAEFGNIDEETLQTMDPEALQEKFKHQQSATGMAMIFVTLAEFQENGKEWNQQAEDDLAGKFTALLQTGGLSVVCYRIDPRRLLITSQTGWYGEEIKDFLLSQPTVMKIGWDNTDYENPDVEQVDPPAREKKKKSPTKKKRRKKKKTAKKEGEGEL